MTWRVPSLSLGDEAIQLFEERARRVKPDFTITDDDEAAAVTEICKRLDGMPFAIELAAARVRALSLTEILDSLHDRFRLLTGGRAQGGAASTEPRSFGGLVARAADRTRTHPVSSTRRRSWAGSTFDAAQEVCGGGAAVRGIRSWTS